VGPKCASWDCDDTDANSYPGAPEICNGKDNNCNGKKDDECTGGEVGCSCGQIPGRGSPGAPLTVVWLLLGVALLGAALGRRPR
jgi:hypothetical protein